MKLASRFLTPLLYLTMLARSLSTLATGSLRNAGARSNAALVNTGTSLLRCYLRADETSLTWYSKQYEIPKAVAVQNVQELEISLHGLADWSLDSIPVGVANVVDADPDRG